MNVGSVMGRKIIIATLLTAGAGAWLRWSVLPVCAAFRAGMEAGRINAAKEAARRGERLPPEGPRPVGGRRRPRLARREARSPRVHGTDPGSCACEKGAVPSPAP